LKLYYPVGLDLADKDVLVVGGGPIAEGKVDQLLECGARIRLVSPTATPRLVALAAQGALRWVERPFEPSDLAPDGPPAWIVIAASDDRAANARVAAAARAAGRLVNAVDDVPSCDFIAMSVLRRGDLQVAISTGGGSPAMARWMREELEARLPDELGPLLDLLAEARLALKAEHRVPPYPTWRRAVTADVLRDLADGERARAREKLFHALGLAETPPTGEAPHPIPLPPGEGARSQGEGVPDRPPAREPDAAAPGRGVVYLVGAGPGDPDLITRRGAELLRAADVVVHDRLVDPRLLRLARSDAELIDVGKTPGGHYTPQAEINRQLVEQASAGRVVVRLKGGDPFVFGRGGEEALALAAAGLRFEVVPGVSAAVAAPAYAGVPLTHRGLASSFTVVTGHGAADDGPLEAALSAYARAGGTLVVLMGLGRLAAIVDGLLAAGCRPSTPAAVVQSASGAGQRTVAGTLGDLVERVAAAKLAPPATLVVGDVVALRERVAWFDQVAPSPQPRPIEEPAWS
jgi:uroporphyrin-III C-methyltransferase/precorrin-2 dehydrogenase/sirohydrochlorin ferrochelatase